MRRESLLYLNNKRSIFRKSSTPLSLTQYTESVCDVMSLRRRAQTAEKQAAAKRIKKKKIVVRVVRFRARAVAATSDHPRSPTQIQQIDQLIENLMKPIDVASTNAVTHLRIENLSMSASTVDIDDLVRR